MEVVRSRKAPTATCPHMMWAVVLLSLVASASSFARPALPQRRETGLATSRHGHHHVPRCAPPLASAGDPPLVDRGVAAAVYLLPALDGFVYGTYVYSNVPPIGAVAYTFLPFVNLFNSLPFAGLILFIGLSFFTRNSGLSRFVRAPPDTRRRTPLRHSRALSRASPRRCASTSSRRCSSTSS